MKSITKLFVLITLISVLASCKKIGISVNAGGYNLNTYSTYIWSKPANQNAIPIFNGNHQLVGTASCTAGDWQVMQNFFLSLQNWPYATAGPREVVVSWDVPAVNQLPTGQIVQ